MTAPHDRVVLRAVAAGALLVAMYVFFFVVPGHDPEPRGLPVAVAGPGADRLAPALERDGRFEVLRLADEGAAAGAILDRRAYGAIVTGGEAPEVLVASAASFQVAQLLPQLAQGAGLPSGPVTDVRPLPEGDPRGLTVNLTMLPLIVTAILGALLFFQLAPGLDARRLALAVLLFAVLGGLVTMLIVRVAIEGLDGSFLALTGMAILGTLAVAMPSAALIGKLGPPGVGVAFIVFLMLGSPASGAASAPELLPEPWQTGGQLLPTGALATGLRNIASFDGAALGAPLVVLILFAALGTAGVVLTGRRQAASPATPSAHRPAAAP